MVIFFYYIGSLKVRTDSVDYKSKRLKYIIIGGLVLVGVLVVVLVVWSISGSILDASYTTKDVLSTTESTTEKVVEDEWKSYGYSKEEWNSMSNKDKMLAMMNSVDTTDLQEASIKKATIFLSCSDSPWYQYMSDASYEIGKVDSGYRIDYTINNEKISVIASWYDATPVVFIKKTEFTESEKEFFKKVGKSWEVPLDDGTYSIQYR